MVTVFGCRSLNEGERGIALVVVLLAMGLLTALGSALVAVTTTETRIATNFRDGQEALYAAEAGLERALQALRTAPNWTDVLAGAVPSGFADATPSPVVPGGGPAIDLSAATAELQASAMAGGWGDNAPVWRLWLWGPVSNLLPAGAIDSRLYLAVWVADDVAETDGDPLTDRNGLVMLHGEAFGAGGARRVVEAAVAHGNGDGAEGATPADPDRVRVVSWTAVR